MKIYDDEKEFEHYLNGPLKNSFIKIAEIDIDNDGKLEKALLYHARLCNIERRYYYARPLLVLDKAKNQIDVEKTEPLLQNPFPNNLQAKAVNHDYQLYDVILHKNIIYFDKWNARDWTVIIYKLAKNETKEICKYKYIFDKPLIKEDY